MVKGQRRVRLTCSPRESENREQKRERERKAGREERTAERGGLWKKRKSGWRPRARARARMRYIIEYVVTGRSRNANTVAVTGSRVQSVRPFVRPAPETDFSASGQLWRSSCRHDRRESQVSGLAAGLARQRRLEGEGEGDIRFS